MITKNDVLLLLSDLKDSGIQTNDITKKLVMSKDIPIEVFQFIHENKPIDLINFYDKLRKSYNNKKSKLYISIVKEIDKPEDVLTTLSSLNLQILLYSKTSTDKNMFLKHSRAKEINLVLAKYFTDYDLTSCLKLLRLIKADLLVSEMITNRRQQI